VRPIVTRACAKEREITTVRYRSVISLVKYYSEDFAKENKYIAKLTRLSLLH